MKRYALIIKATINAPLNSSYSHYGLETLGQWIRVIYKPRFFFSGSLKSHVRSSWNIVRMAYVPK